MDTKFNFLFNPHSKMKESMFDSERAYKLVSKIVEIAESMNENDGSQ